MARKIKVDMTGVEAYGKVGEGIHPAKIVEVEQTTSQAGDDMLVTAFEVTSGPDKGGRVYDNFVLTQKALWKLKVLLKAIGMKCDGKLVVDLDRMIGKTCDIEVFHDEYNGQKRAKISDYYKFGTHSNAGADEEIDEDIDDDEVDEIEEEEAPAPAKKSTRNTKKKPTPKPEPEPEDDEDEWEDDEEEEPEEEPAPAPKKRRAPAKKAPAKKAPAKRKQPEPEPEEEEDDEDEWEEDDE